jgi:hypothetical protein
MVNTKSTFHQIPTIVGQLAVCLPVIVVELIVSVDAIVSVVAHLATVTRAAQRLMHIAATAIEETALRLPGALAQDVDHAIHRVRAPDRRARTADHFDAIHVINEDLLDIPIDSGEQRRINRASVNHHQQLVGELGIEAARGHRPVAGINRRHLHSGDQPQRVGDRGNAGTQDIVIAQHKDGGCGVVEVFLFLGD